VVDDEIFERRIYSAFWEGEPLGEPNLRSVRSQTLQIVHDAPKFSAVQEHCPPENHSLFATRRSLPYGLGISLILPIFPTDSKSVSTKTKPAKAG